MSEKTVLYENEGSTLTYDAGVLLQRIADGLCQGKIELEGNESQTVSCRWPRGGHGDQDQGQSQKRRDQAGPGDRNEMALDAPQ